MSEQPAAPTDAPTPAAPPAPAEPATPPTPEPPAAPEWDGKVESLPEAAQKLIRDLRSESADKRTKLSAAEQAQRDAVRALAKAAGIELPGDEGTAPDPAELANQLTASQKAAQTLQREHQVLLSAITASADHKRLLDSRSFLAKVEHLDPMAEDFTAKVDAAITGALTEDPTLKVARVAGASTVDHAGGSGEGTAKPTNLADAVAARMAR